MVKKSKQSNLTNILLTIIILLMIFFSIMYVRNETMNLTVDDETQDELDEPYIFKGCTLDINPTYIEEGESVTGTIHDGANTLCTVFYNYNSTGWKLLGNIVTDSNGYYSQTVNPEYAGTYEFRAKCGDCITNLETLTIEPYDWNEGEQYTPVTLCESLYTYESTDLSGFCGQGYCDDENCVCDNYRDYTDLVHRCACTETSFCNACYEYYYTTSCECATGYTREIVTRSTFRCVPEGYYCDNGVPVEMTGPFPE